MRRTRRRRRYNWLPIDGTNNTDAAFGICTATTIALDVPNTGNPVVGVTSITFDEDQDTPTTGLGNEQTPLVDLIGNEYFLKRIVGKVFVDLSVQDTGGVEITTDAFQAVLVTAGFFVARQDRTDPATPLAWATNPDDYNIQSTTVIREPWIWRRSWILGMGFPYPAGVSIGIVTEPVNNYPPTNAAYGSAMDGPHVDARTARRVRQEERLFFTATAQTYPVSSTFSSHPEVVEVVRCGYDVRLLGALRKARNRGSF